MVPNIAGRESEGDPAHYAIGCPRFDDQMSALCFIPDGPQSCQTRRMTHPPSGNLAITWTAFR